MLAISRRSPLAHCLLLVAALVAPACVDLSRPRVLSSDSDGPEPDTLTAEHNAVAEPMLAPADGPRDVADAAVPEDGGAPEAPRPVGQEAGMEAGSLRDGLVEASSPDGAVDFARDAQAPGENLVVNPGFESGKLDGWRMDNGNVRIVGAPSAHAGSGAAELTSGNTFVSQNLQGKLKPGVKYTFRAWVKVITAGTQFGAPTMRLSRYVDVGSSELGKWDAVNSVAAGWQELIGSQTFTAADLASAVHFGVRHFGFDGTSVVDDIEAIQTP